VECEAIIVTTCPQKHRIKRKCHDIAAALCQRCEKEAGEKGKSRQRDYKLDQERQAKQDDYARRLAEIQDEINHQKRLLKDKADEGDMQNMLSQNREDLAKMKQRVKTISNSTKQGFFRRNPPMRRSRPAEDDSSTSVTRSDHPAPTSRKVVHDRDVESTETGTETGYDSPPDEWDHSESKDDWKYQKEFEGAENEALDQLMNMIGKGIRHCTRVMLTTLEKVSNR
jgi:hypothetical protein